MTWEKMQQRLSVTLMGDKWMNIIRLLEEVDQRALGGAWSHATASSIREQVGELVNDPGR